MFLGFKSAMKDCIHSISSIYQTYVNIGKEEFPSLFVSPPTPLVFNGAGSTSFPYYNDVPLSYVMNDLSIGLIFFEVFFEGDVTHTKNTRNTKHKKHKKNTKNTAR